MRWQRRFVLWLVPAVGCGSVQALPPDGEPDVPPPADGPTIQISGTVREVGTQDVAGGAAIGVVRIADRAVLGTTRSQADGTYSVAVPGGAVAVDAYLDVAYPGRLRTHAYLVPQLTSDASADVLVVSGPSLQQLANAAGVAQPASTGFVLVQLFESNQQASGGIAAVTPSGDVCYTEPMTQQPRCSLTATDSDGLAWMFAVPSGSATVSGELSDTVPVRPRQVRVEAGLFIQIGLEP